MTSLFFCQNDVLIGGSFWQKDSLVTFILLDLSLFKHFSLSQIFVISLYWLQENLILMKKVFNCPELHFSEVTSYKIHTFLFCPLRIFRPSYGPGCWYFAIWSSSFQQILIEPFGTQVEISGCTLHFTLKGSSINNITSSYYVSFLNLHPPCHQFFTTEVHD